MKLLVVMWAGLRANPLRAIVASPPDRCFVDFLYWALRLFVWFGLPLILKFLVLVSCRNMTSGLTSSISRYSSASEVLIVLVFHVAIFMLYFVSWLRS